MPYQANNLLGFIGWRYLFKLNRFIIKIWYMIRFIIQFNLGLTNHEPLYNGVFDILNERFFNPNNSKIYGKDPPRYTTKPRYSEHIFPVPWFFVVSRFQCVNTFEIPGELSRVNMISSHVKITSYFTRENYMLFYMWKLPVIFTSLKITIAIATYSLKRYSDVLLYDRNIIGSTSEIFGYLRKSLENDKWMRRCILSSVMFGKVRLAFGTILIKSSKSSENSEKRRQ